MNIYFDEAAISKPKKEVIDLAIDIMNNHWHNPNSAYDDGLEARQMINEAKDVIAKEISCNKDDLIMCASGSEANTMAIHGIVNANGKFCCVTSTIEHSSILNNPCIMPLIHVDADGKFNMQDISQIRGSFVSICYANSEIGVIQDIDKIIPILHGNNNLVHVDATAIFGKQKINVQELGVDAMTFTAQKIGGLTGASCLYVKHGVLIEPLIYGHNTLRGGTPNTMAICCFAKAIQCINWDNIIDIQNKRDYFIDKILKIHNVTLNGSRTDRLCNNINVCLHDIIFDNQQLIAFLNLYGYDTSASSACNAGSKEPSTTLLAIGLSAEEANKSLRITITENTTYEEIDKFVDVLNKTIQQFNN